MIGFVIKQSLFCGFISGSSAHGCLFRCVDTVNFKVKNGTMNIYQKLSLYFLFVLLSGCAVGPLVSHETARTVGMSKHEVIAGFGEAGYVFNWNYGLNEDLDLGLHWESLSIGLRAKYAFINKKEGWSLASALGAGSSIGGRHYYGDLIGSYLSGPWEPYGTLRAVHVNADPIEFKNQQTGSVEFTVDKTEFNYAQAILGTRYWFSPNWLMSFEASSFAALTSGLVFSNAVLLGGSLGYRF